MELFKKKEKNKEQGKKTISEALSLNIEVEEENKEGYILSGKTYRKIMMVYPINTDFLEDSDLEVVRDKIAAALNLVDRFGIYIQKEQVDFTAFKKNLNDVYENQSSVVQQRKQKTLIQYVEKVEKKLENIERFYIVLEEKNLIELNQKIRNFKQILSETHLATQVISKRKILDLLAKRMFSEIQRPRNLEDIYPSTMTNYKGMYQIINGVYKTQIIISNYPAEVTDFNWLSSLFKIDDSINIALVGTKKSPTEIISQMNKNISSKRIKLREVRQQSEVISIEQEIESSIKVLEETAASNNSVFDVCLIIDIDAQTEEDLKIKINRIRTIISSLSLKSIMAYRKGFMPFVATLPILTNNMITRDYVYNFLSTDIGSLIIFDNSDYFREDGIPIGKNPETGSLYAFNPFSGKDFFNPHILIIGFTGSGKTFFLKYFCERMDAYVDYIIRLDIAGTLTTPHCKRFVFATDGDLKLNPFYIRAIDSSKADFEDNPNPVTEKILDLIKFFNIIIDEVSQYKISVIESCLQNLYQYAGISDHGIREDAIEPTFDTFKFILNMKKEYILNELKEKENILEKQALQKEYECLDQVSADIRPYTDGAYANLLNGTNNFKYDKNTVLDFSKLPEVLRKPIYDLVLKDLWKFCIQDGSNEKDSNVPKKIIVADEVHEFVDQDETLRILSSKFIKQGRKYNTMVINATQDFADLQVNKHAQAILSNCNFKFLFKLGTNDYEIAQRSYNLTNKEMKELQGNKLSATKDSASKGKGILIIDALHLGFKAEATIEEIKIIDPKLYHELISEE